MSSLLNYERYLSKKEQNQCVPIDFAFITALPIERDALLQHLESCITIQDDLEPLTYYLGTVSIPATNESYKVVVVMLLGMGNDEAAVSTMSVLQRWQPTSIIMVGIAGGVPSKVNLGDVVVAKFVYYYELAKRTIRGEKRRAQQFASDRLLYGRALAYEAGKWKSDLHSRQLTSPHTDLYSPRAHFGVIGSGEKVIANTKALDRLLNECPELLAVAMEGAGVARAATHQAHPVRFLEVRSICDYANELKNDDWHQCAANTAAAFAIGFLRSRPVPPVTTETLLRDLLALYTQYLQMLASNEEASSFKEDLKTHIMEVISMDFTSPMINRTLANPNPEIPRLSSPQSNDSERNLYEFIANLLPTASNRNANDCSVNPLRPFQQKQTEADELE